MRTAKIDRKIEYLPIVGGELKATNDAQYIIEGYLNYLKNIDFGDDRTMPGAFKKTLSDSYARKSAQNLDFLWPYLWNHSYDTLPPGGIFEANEDSKGLYIKVQFNPDTQLGRELYASFKMGTMKKQSMGYRAIQVEWVKDDGRSIRNLLEVAVMEGSAVVFPMNDLAAVEVVKARSFAMPTKTPQKTTKDFSDRYHQQVISDWLYGDWYTLMSALQQSIQDIFAVGDQPMDDLTNIVLNDTDDGPGFITALKNYVQEGIDLGYSDYLQEQQSDANSYGIGYMAHSDNPDIKAGRALSAANVATLKKATDGISQHVKSLKSMMSSNADSMAAHTEHQTKNEEDEDISTLLTSLKIKNAFR